MSGKRLSPALDWFRLLAAFLVVCNHTSPLDSFAPGADFWLTRVLARVAVPFFFMVSGYFLSQKNWAHTGKFLKKTALVYALAVVLYLPLNWYNGGFASPLQWLQKLLLDGTLYHLWYFPAVLLGVVIARNLARLPAPAALSLAGLLYLIGVGGDSYYGFTAAVPALKTLYDGIFLVFSYTRNGLFFAPLFLLLGASGLRWSRWTSAVGLVLSLLGMSLEAFWLRDLDWPRHDSMYLLLPLCMVFLFSLLLGENRGEDKKARRVSLLVYLLHPWSIVLVRGGAEAAGLEGIFVENSLGHFCAVLALTVWMALALDGLRPIRPDPRGRAWAEVDLEALARNAQTLESTLSPECRLMAVVKADGYGHGAVPAARRLWKEGVRAFAVASLSEGISLRKHGVRGTILILGYTPPREVPLLRRWHLTQTVADEAHGRALAAQGKPVKVHLALDTGMHRLGVPAEDRAAIQRLYRLKHLRITGTFSHLCVSDSLEPDQVDFTQKQLSRFYGTLDWMREQGLAPGRSTSRPATGCSTCRPSPAAMPGRGSPCTGCTATSPPPSAACP